MLSKRNHNQRSLEVTQELPKTKKCVLDAGIIATLVCTAIKCWAAVVAYVVKLKCEVVIMCELFVASTFLPFYCINLALSADSILWSRMAVGGDKLQLSYNIIQGTKFLVAVSDQIF
jgi:hypothetical protein